jgi:hypothetical protein
MFEWRPVASSVIAAEGYDADAETIYIRFNDGKEYWYSECPQQVWEEFTAPGQSRGQYLNQVLRAKPYGRHVG